MTLEKFGTNVQLKLFIEGLDEDLGPWVDTFRWSSFMNSGYTIYGRFLDPNLIMFTTLANEKYFADARNSALKVTFQIEYLASVEDAAVKKTEERVALMTNLHAIVPDGAQSEGYFEFIATDVPTWHLNSGNAGGGVYVGRVSDVITQVVKEFAPGVDPIVSQTTDSKTNKWHPMRQHPLQFINTLIDWSASVTNNKTCWVVASVDEKLIIKEHSELQAKDFGEYAINTEYPGIQNCVRWEMDSESYLSNIQSNLGTGGISAISGLYVSKDNTNSITKDLARINDHRTANKLNINLTDEQSFEKPTSTDRGWTFVRGIPEDSSGAIGIQYQQYIDGRARNLFVNSLYRLFRMKVTVFGNPKLHDSSDLGVSTVTLQMNDADEQPYIFSGQWMTYGFEHIITRERNWYTNLFVSRFDYDAESKKIPKRNPPTSPAFP